LILLNEANAAVLDKQLSQEQDTSIREINAIRSQAAPSPVPRFSRMEHLKLPPVSFYQLRVEYLAITEDTAPDTGGTLAMLAADPGRFKNEGTLTTRYLNERHAADNQSFAVTREMAVIVEQAGGFASFSAWLNEIARESLGDLPVAAWRPYEAVLLELFDRITCIVDGQRYYNTLFDQAAIRSAIRLAFHTRRELHSREEIIEQAADLLLVNKLKDIPDHALLWPDQEKCRTILQTDAQPAAKPNDPALLEQKKREIEKIAADLGNPAIADTMIRQLMEAEAVRTASIDTKDRTLHYLPYDFRQSRFEKTFIETALNLADVRAAGLEIYYNGESSLTDFRIDCYARTGRTWRRVGFYTPDFLILRREGGAIRKVLILETKGAGYADQPAFVARRRFMENDFIRLNNQKFGYRRFDFLMLRDDTDMPRNLNTLNTRIAAFFGDENTIESGKQEIRKG